jgi:PKD domain
VRRRVGRSLVAAVSAVLISSVGSASAAPGRPPSARAGALYNLKAYPLASFTWFPRFPHTGEPISLVSTSKGVTSPIVAYAWDVADNGPFGPFVAGRPVTTATFATPASHQVRLRVTAADGASSIAVQTIQMSTPPPGVLSPFPTVRIVGTVFHSRVTLKQLAVKAPAGALITITCQGRRCPARSARKPAATRGPRAIWARFHPFERLLPAGAVLEIRVTRNAEVGAYTRFVVRHSRLPVRADSCLDPAGVKPIACPSS